MSAGEHLSRGQFPESYHVPPGGFGPVFHATHRLGQGGRGKFLKGDTVHVGTPSSAADRTAGTLDRDVELYEMFVRSDARVAPLTSDLVANIAAFTPGYNAVRVDPHVTEQVNLLRQKDYDVYPYENEAEDVGSISYAVKPRALKRVRPVKGGRLAARDFESAEVAPSELLHPVDVEERASSREAWLEQRAQKFEARQLIAKLSEQNAAMFKDVG